MNEDVFATLQFWMQWSTKPCSFNFLGVTLQSFTGRSRKNKDAFRVWAGLWGGVTSHLVEWASPWHPLESKHKLRSSDFTCRSSVQPILTQYTATNTVLRGKLHMAESGKTLHGTPIYKTFHNNLQKLYWRWFKTIMICVCLIFVCLEIKIILFQTVSSRRSSELSGVSPPSLSPNATRLCF